jgi:hypothetical protein
MSLPEQVRGGDAATNGYNQLSLEGVEPEKRNEVTIENCVVLTRPTYKKNGKRPEWQCSLYAPPDIFHQERDDLIEAQTTSFAQSANTLRLRPGDRLDISGVLSQHELTLGNGEKKLVHHLVVSDIHILKRAERVSLTVYERKRGK